MKLNRLETHDRYEHFLKDQSKGIGQGAEDCMKRNTLSLKLQEKSPYVYLFAHPRTSDDGYSKRMIWQPRLTRPNPQTNSYLFRGISNTDLIEICWLLPPREMWSQYEKGKVTESELTLWSIKQFEHNRSGLAQKHPDDLTEEQIKSIYQEISMTMFT